jgi:hypothetical protein
MTHYIKELGIIDEALEHDIIHTVRQNIDSLEFSQLYSVSDKTKFVDLTKRSSKYKAIVNDKLFKLVELLVKKITKNDKSYDYKLIKNDVTYIRYEKDDFFQPHEDYLSYTSNTIEEYTLIICANAQCSGGGTIFHFNDFFNYTSLESTTPLHCLLFRKDINHEGEKLKFGFKEIITCNLYGLPKSCDKIVVVHFVNNNKKYCISLNKIKSVPCKITNEINESCDDTMINYFDNCHTYEQFEIIYRIISNCYISTKEYVENYQIIKDYEISDKNVLICGATEDKQKKYKIIFHLMMILLLMKLRNRHNISLST